MRFNGKNVVITGINPKGGMGREMALSFAKNGSNLSLNYWKENESDIKRLEKQLKQTGNEVIFTEGDISEEKTAEKLVQNTIKKLGTIDVLINNAAITTPMLLTDMDVNIWDEMIKVNLRSVFLTTKKVVPVMKSQKSGRIINMASQVGQKGGEEHCHYAATKAGIIGFTKSIARELSEYNITANCIAPGPINTPLLQSVNDSWKQNKEKELVISRFGEVEEVAPTALFLASNPEGNLYTGQTLGPNSGDVML